MNEQANMMNQQQQMNLMSMNQMNPHQQQPPPPQPQPQMVPMGRSYGMWVPPPQFQNPNPKFNPNPVNPIPGSMKSGFNKSLGPRSNWKGKKVNDKRRKDQLNSIPVGSGSSTGGGGGMDAVNGGVGNYQPPNLNELQHQNRLKTRKFFPKRNFNKNNNINTNMNMGGNFNNKYNGRSAPYAPRNTTSFLIRAKKSGGIASLVSPCPVTPAVLPTPIFSPSREVLVDTAKEEWGVDGYGSMKGLIRLRSPGHETEAHDEEEEDEGGSSESDVEEHVEVERRLDHDLSRFEMIYNPHSGGVAGGMDYHNVLENRVDDQDTHIAQLEDENLILKERLFLMERELGDLRRRMQCLERRGNGGEEINEEVVENESENDSESRGEEAHSIEDNNDEFSEDNQGDSSVKGKIDDGSNPAEGFEAAATTENNLVVDVEGKVDKNDDNVNKENNIDEFIEANNMDEKVEKVADVEDTKLINNDDNDLLDVEAKAENIVVDVESDVCMEEVGGVAKDGIVMEDIAN